MSNIEYQSMFALWCLIKAPLMLGTDLTQMSMESESYKIISNERLIAINQDPLGKKNIFQYKIYGITKYLVFLSYCLISFSFFSRDSRNLCQRLLFSWPIGRHHVKMDLSLFC